MYHNIYILDIYYIIILDIYDIYIYYDTLEIIYIYTHICERNLIF